jgi:hydrophobic/amphiphilic exporter-1 (mainly G- bacteria), HAE1 family
VFFCFPYFQGRLKVFYLPLAIVITAALAASLLVSFTLIPALSPRLLEQKKTKKARAENRWYEKTMTVLLRHPLEVLLLVMVVLYGSFRWFKAEVSVGEWFRWYSKNYLYVSIGLPPGTAIERTDELIKKFEEKALQGGYEKEINVDVSSERASMVIGFPSAVENSAVPYLLKGELIQLATQFADININVSGFDPEGYYYNRSGGSYLGSSIKFTGYNLKKLKDITASLEKTLLKNRRIKQVRIISSSRDYWWNSDNALENILKIDRDAMQKYNLNPQYLYYFLSAILKGNFSTPLRMNVDGTETAISIKFPQADLIDLSRFQETLIKSDSGEYLRLGDIAQLEERKIPGAIDRENQQFEQTVMWEYVGSAKAEERYRKAVFAGLQLPPGFAASLETQGWMTEQEKSQLAWAIVFSLVIIFMILAALYESLIYPFYILMAVPLAMIGVFVAFVLAKYPFDSSAYIGVIILSGIVVKNAILLVDHINLKRRQGFELAAAVIQGARERIRPVFMTTSATVCGILPLLLIQGQEGVKRQIWSTLALCTVGGLVSSTLFILVVIPLLYYHGDGLHAWLQLRVAEMRGVSAGGK